MLNELLLLYFAFTVAKGWLLSKYTCLTSFYFIDRQIISYYYMIVADHPTYLTFVKQYILSIETI